MKTVCCLLCNGLITLVQDEDRFSLHMNSLHDVFFNLEFLRAVSYMDDEEKNAVIGVMKIKLDEESELSNSKIQQENPKDVFNEEDLKLSDIVQIRKVTVDIPIHRIHGTLSEIPLPTPAPTTEKSVRTKIFICNYCHQEFPAAFQSLADHKMKVHKLSRKDSQIITMKHVRYENLPPVSEQNKSSPIVDKPDRGSQSSDLSGMFTDIFKPKSVSPKAQQTEKTTEPVTKIKKEPEQPQDPPSSTFPIVKVKQEKSEAKKDEEKEREMQQKLELIMVAEAKAQLKKQVVRTPVVEAEVEAKAQLKKQVVRTPVVEAKVEAKAQLKKQDVGPVRSPVVEAKVVAETPQNCVLCNLKISSESKLKLHMARRHLVPEERFHLFDDGGKSLFRVRDTQTSSTRNTCKLCDQTNPSLGTLWNHYKKHHNMTKDTIKSLITKTKCDICFSHVTFIRDHYRTVHNQEAPAADSDQRSEPAVRTPAKDSNSVVKTEKTPRKSNEERLTKIWETAQRKSPPVKTKWSNIFDFKSSRDATVSKPGTANSDNIFTMSTEATVKPSNKKKEITGRDSSKGHNCEKCGKQFQSMRILRNHLLFHRAEIKTARDRKQVVPKPKLLKEEPTDEYQFCDYCEYSSVSVSDFKKHVESRHKMEVDRETSGNAEIAGVDPMEGPQEDPQQHQEKIQESLSENRDKRETDRDSVSTGTEKSEKPNDREYVAKLIDKLKDIDDSDDDDEEEEEEIEETVSEKECEETVTIVDDQPEEEVVVVEDEPGESLDLSQLPSVLADNLRRSEYFRLHQSELSSLRDQGRIESFTPDPPLGLGWRVRYFASAGGGTIEREFLSPHNIRLASAEAVVEYITCSSLNTPQTIINNIKYYLGVK